MDQSTILFIALFVAIGVAYMYMRRCHKIEKWVNEMRRKTDLEQSLELATSDELLKEMVRRDCQLIIIIPKPSNEPMTTMSIFVKGMPAPIAIMHMAAASAVLMTQPPGPPPENFPVPTGTD